MSGEYTTDRSVDLLLQKLSDCSGPVLIIADENWTLIDWTAVGQAQHCSIDVISNRIDVVNNATEGGVSCHFSDFDFSQLPAAHYQAVLYRVSKERATSHHVINHAANRLLIPGGTLLLSGAKNDGLKSYLKQACQLFGDHTQAEKHGSAYRASIRLRALAYTPLTDKNYAAIRSLNSLDQGRYHSKPGVFGWDKIDRGSAFLIDHLGGFIALFATPPKSLLDLGCGYGYLACEASRHGFNEIVASDNNAAAISACRENFARLLTVPNRVIAGDAGGNIEQRFDLLLCNPPFHAGFSVDDRLGVKFLRNARRLLAISGRALFVVNRFIILEKYAREHFKRVDVIADNGAYKLIALSH